MCGLMLHKKHTYQVQTIEGTLSDHPSFTPDLCSKNSKIELFFSSVRAYDSDTALKYPATVGTRNIIK